MNKDTFFKYVDYDYTEITPIWECQWCKSHYAIDGGEYNYCPMCGCKIHAWKGEDEFWKMKK